MDAWERVVPNSFKRFLIIFSKSLCRQFWGDMRTVILWSVFKSLDGGTRRSVWAICYHLYSLWWFRWHWSRRQLSLVVSQCGHPHLLLSCLPSWILAPSWLQPSALLWGTPVAIRVWRSLHFLPLAQKRVTKPGGCYHVAFPRVNACACECEMLKTVMQERKEKSCME